MVVLLGYVLLLFTLSLKYTHVEHLRREPMNSFCEQQPLTHRKHTDAHPKAGASVKIPVTVNTAASEAA